MTPSDRDPDIVEVQIDPESLTPHEGRGLLAWIFIPLFIAFAVLVAWVVVTIDTKDEQRKDAEKRYEELRDLPTPTVTVETPGPVKTVVVETPGPERTIYVDRASRNKDRAPAATKSRVTASAAVTLACIRKHESGGNYRAVSDSGTYRGAYQMSRVYSPTWAKRAGHGQWASKPADQWPPAVQDAVAYDMGHGNRWAAWSDFTSYSCPGF